MIGADTRRRHQAGARPGRPPRAARPPARRRRHQRRRGRSAGRERRQRRRATPPAASSALIARRRPSPPLPLRKRKPSCRSCARSRLIACVRIRTSCSRTRSRRRTVALRRRHAMRRAINPQATRLGQRRHVAPVRLDPPRPLPIHQRVIRIRDDHLVAASPRRLRPPIRSRCPLSSSTRIARAAREHAASTPPASSLSVRSSDHARRCRRSESGYSSDGDRWHHTPWLAAPLRLERVIPCGAHATTQGQPAASSHLRCDPVTSVPSVTSKSRRVERRASCPQRHSDLVHA